MSNLFVAIDGSNLDANQQCDFQEEVVFDSEGVPYIKAPSSHLFTGCSQGPI